jgi:hypothetical protein
MFNPLCDPLPSLYLCAAVLVPVVAGVRPLCPISPYNNTVQSVRCMLLFIMVYSLQYFFGCVAVLLCFLQGAHNTKMHDEWPAHWSIRLCVCGGGVHAP